jgi:hypothetical protein
MPANGLSTGIDHELVFNDISGVRQFVTLESFTAKEDATTDKVVAMDGTVRHPKFHVGWSGSFMLQRSNNVMDKYIALQEASYYQGIDQVPMTITETMTEVDGSVSQYQYTNVVITLDSAGNWSGTEIVRQSISFQASRKNLLSNNG